MCGLVGIFGPKLGLEAEDMLEDGLMVCSLRGTDSVGWGVVPKHEKMKPFVNKRLGCPPVFVKAPLAGANCLLGHVRSATIGNRNDREIAHPFHFDNIIGAHNGTLRGDWRHQLQEGTNEIFASDSQAVFYNFAYWGVEETVKRIEGAWCFVWWDDDTRTINMLRNEERPLWTAQGESGNLYWASEHWMISAMLRQGERDRDKLVKTLSEDGKSTRFFHKLPTNVWRSFTLNEEGKVVRHEDKPVEGLPPRPFVAADKNWDADSTLWGSGDYSYETYENGKWVVAEKKGNTRTMTVKPDQSLVHLPAAEEPMVTAKGKLWRTVCGTSYVCKPGQPEIPFSNFLLGFDGHCMECEDFISVPEDIGYLPDDYSWCVCSMCVLDWDKQNWDDLIDEDIENMDANQIDALIARGAKKAGEAKRAAKDAKKAEDRTKPFATLLEEEQAEIDRLAAKKPMSVAVVPLTNNSGNNTVVNGSANKGPCELGNPGVPLSDNDRRLLDGLIGDKKDPLPPLLHEWKYVLRDKEGQVVHSSGCRTKAQLDIYTKKRKADHTITVEPTDELDRVCRYVPAPTPKENEIPLDLDLNDRIPPSLVTKRRPLLELPPFTSDWPKFPKWNKAEDGPTY